MVKSIFSKNLVRIRNYYEWTQEMAAQQIGIKRATLASYEEGRAEPCIDILVKIARAYRLKDLLPLLNDSDFLISRNSMYRVAWDSDIDQKYSMTTGRVRAALDVLLGIENEIKKP